jgi:hypothetical protein
MNNTKLLSVTCRRRYCHLTLCTSQSLSIEDWTVFRIHALVLEVGSRDVGGRIILTPFEVQWLANECIVPALNLKNSTCYPHGVYSVSFPQQTTNSSLHSICNGGEMCLL